MQVPKELFEKLVAEYQTRMYEGGKELSMVSHQLKMREKEKKVSELTRMELESMDKSTPSYRSVGRMFIRQDLSSLCSELDKKSKDADVELAALKKAEIKYTKEVEDAQRSLQGLIKRVTEESANKD